MTMTPFEEWWVADDWTVDDFGGGITTKDVARLAWMAALERARELMNETLGNEDAVIHQACMDVAEILEPL